jgi:hypothetical protein
MKLTDVQEELLQDYKDNLTEFYKHQEFLKVYLAEQGEKEAQQAFLGILKSVGGIVSSLVKIIEDETVKN